MKLKFGIAAILLVMLCGRAAAQDDWEIPEDDRQVQAGDMSPDFSLEDENGKLHSLEDFKGKYVLIDFWASYCAPCQKEIPHLKELEKKLEGKNIHFVSISIDMNKEEWLEKLKEVKPGGKQLVFSRSNILFIHRYRVETIPRYVLLDKEGRIIDPDMPRPSNPEMLKILEALEGL